MRTLPAASWTEETAAKRVGQAMNKAVQAFYRLFWRVVEKII